MVNDNLHKRVTIDFDNKEIGPNKIKMTFYNNRVLSNDGQSCTMDPNLRVLGYSKDDIVYKSAKEVLEEMLKLVNEGLGEV